MQDYEPLKSVNKLADITNSTISPVIQMKEFWEQGVIHAKTRCWAQGMDGWRPLQTVPQLKWTLMATGQAVMNESDLATLVLNMLIRMTEYYPSKSVCLSVCTEPQSRITYL